MLNDKVKTFRWKQIIFIALIVFVIFNIILIMSFFWKPIDICKTLGASMEPTLKDGQYYLIDKIFFKNKKLNRSDIISFKKGGINYTKRIIGLPGETITFDNKEGKVKITNQEHPNGFILKESYLPKDTITKMTNAYNLDDKINHIENSYTDEQIQKILSNNQQAASFIESTPVSITIPQDYYFVMGDNRSNSLDSRFNIFGLVERDEVEGKVILFF